MLLNSKNSKNVNRLIRFFSRDEESGYVFAFAANTSLIAQVNNEITTFFKSQQQEIGIFFLNKESDDSILQSVRSFVNGKKFKALIIANLFEFISDKDKGQAYLTEINFARESFYAFKLPVLFWVSEQTFPLLSNNAPDLYSQRRLPSFEFEAEVPEPVEELQFKAPPLVPRGTETSRLKVLKEQFVDALNRNIENSSLVNEFLLPYLSELAENYRKTEVLELLSKYTDSIETEKESNIKTLADIYSNIHEYKTAIEYYTKTIECETGFSRDEFAIVYLKRGDNYKILGDISKALDDYIKGEKLINELYETFPKNISSKNNLAILYERLGDTYTALGKLDMALVYFEKYTELEKELNEANSQNTLYKSNLAISYEKLGETQSSLGNLEKALTYFEDEIKLFEELYEAYPQNVSFKNGLAISYKKLGSTQSSLGNLEKALTWFELDISLSKELYEAYPQNVSFKNGLAISYEKLGSTQSSLGNLEKALTYFEDGTKLFEELYEAYPQNVSFKNGLAISYIKLGVFFDEKENNPSKALPWNEKAEKIWKELKNGFPMYNEFSKNYNWVVNEIIRVKKSTTENNEQS